MPAARPVDRRVARTRARLHEAFLSLMIEKGYEQTTVGDILARADVGRATFYAHFAGKEALLEAGFSELRELLRGAARSEARRGVPLAFSLPMFEHAEGHRPLYRALVGRRSGAAVLQHVRRVVADVVREELAAAAGSGVPAGALEQYVVASFLAVLTWWLDHRTGLSPAEADALFRRLVLPGLEAARSR